MADPDELASTIRTSAPDRGEEAVPRVEPGRRFALGGELGRGGMGRVIAGTDRVLGRPVAIKQVLSREPEHVARFEREIRITAQLEHPSIVPIHEAGRDEHGVPYYVMRKIEGEPLAHRIARAGEAERLGLLPSVLAAIDATAFAHARAIIHRDIKPANILLGEHGATLLIDWGLARQLDADPDDAPGRDVRAAPAEAGLTTAGAAYGTPGYMSPEQARGEPVDRRTDVYALGATLFHVLAGRPAHAEHPAGEQLALAMLGEPPPLAELRGAPPELVAIVGKAMAPTPAERYPDASAMAADVRAFLAGQLVGAHRYTRRERVARFVRRHRLAVLLAALAVIAGAAALVLIVRSRSSALAAMQEAQARQLQLEASLEDRLLDTAEQLATVDPTRTVALLRELSPTSPQLPRARDIAVTAASHGIARGSAIQSGFTSAVAISPAGRWLASADTAGTVALHELAHARSRIVARFDEKSATSLAWLDERTLAIGGLARGIVLLDVETGTRRIIAPGIQLQNLQLWVTPRGTLWALDREGNLREVVPATGASTVLASDVELAVVDDGFALLAGKTVRLLDASGLHALATSIVPTGSSKMAISRKLGRFAMADGATILEWELARPTAEPRRWTLLDTAIVLGYGPHLCALVRGGSLYSLADGVQPVASLGPAMAISTQTRDGLVVASTEGPMVLVTDVGVLRLASERADVRMIASHRGTTQLAVGSITGRVRWWDLRTVLPRGYDLPSLPTPCAADHHSLLFTTMLELLEVDRATGAQRIVGRANGRCAARREDRVLVELDEGVELVELTTGTQRTIVGARDAEIGARGEVLTARGDRVFEIGRSGRERELWRAPGQIEQLALSDDWLAVELRGGMLVRLDLATLTPAALHAPDIDTFLLSPSGVLWYARGRALWRWDGYAATQLRDLPSPVRQLESAGDGLGISLHDRSLWFADEHGVVNRATPNGHRRLWLHAGRATSLEGHGKLLSQSLAHGTTTTRPVPSSVSQLFAFEDTLVAQAHDRFFVYEAPIGIDAPSLHSWLDGITNAAIDPASDELVWR